MKKCNVTKKDCPWVNEKCKCCGYSKELLDCDICPAMLHNWNDIYDEFKLKKEK